jgi:hypothetical protein
LSSGLPALSNTTMTKQYHQIHREQTQANALRALTWAVCMIVAALIVLSTGGCAASNPDLATRARKHIAPMEAQYMHGVDTYPGATASDKATYRRSWTDLESLLDAAGAATQPTEPR